jgi:PTH1 family peptidyl-tRNA hydrolase
LENLNIIIGLGNPGPRYDNTRHNVGFDTIDFISGKYGIKVTKLKHKALIGEGIMEGERVLLAKPQTFMNLSGESVREIMEWYKIPSHHMILVYDDIDLPLGKIRVRAKGSSGTHNGMRSVIYQMQTDEFPRVRIGIGKPVEGWELADYVLGRFSPEDRKIVDESVLNAADAVSLIVKSGIISAMNKYN